MRIEEKPDAIVIETTDVHLPHAIGEALHDAFKGSLKFRYPEESYFVEVKEFKIGNSSRLASPDLSHNRRILGLDLIFKNQR